MVIANGQRPTANGIRHTADRRIIRSFFAHRSNALFLEPWNVYLTRMEDTRKPTPAVFLDRDGTLNSDPGYPSRMADIELLPGALDAVRLLNRLPAKVVVITNQSGVARGMFSERDVRLMNAEYQAVFARADAPLAGMYYCPHHPEAVVPVYRKNCDCRKPGRALFDRAAAELGLVLENSVMVGDKYSDVIAGKRLGMRAILVLTGEGHNQLGRYRESAPFQPDLICEDLPAAARWIADRWKPGLGVLP